MNLLLLETYKSLFLVFCSPLVLIGEYKAGIGGGGSENV